jgi:hypothetical protein
LGGGGKIYLSFLVDHKGKKRKKLNVWGHFWGHDEKHYSEIDSKYKMLG